MDKAYQLTPAQLALPYFQKALDFTLGPVITHTPVIPNDSAGSYNGRNTRKPPMNARIGQTQAPDVPLLTFCGTIDTKWVDLNKGSKVKMDGYVPRTAAPPTMAKFLSQGGGGGPSSSHGLNTTSTSSTQPRESQSVADQTTSDKLKATFVVVGLDQLVQNAAFQYTIQGHREGGKHGAFNVFRCVSYQLARRIPTGVVLKSLFDSLDKITFNTLFDTLRIKSDDAIRRIDITNLRRELNNTKDEILLCFRERPAIRRYFLLEEYVKLEKFYPDHIINVYSMNWADTRKLAELVGHNPYYLCCSYLYDVTWLTTKDIKEREIEAEASVRRTHKGSSSGTAASTLSNQKESSFESVPIHELELSDLETLGVPMNTVLHVAISIYKAMLKDHFGSKHMFTRAYDVNSMFTGIHSPEIVDQAIKFLIDKEVIIRKDFKFYLFKAFLTEWMIAWSIAELDERHLKVKEAFQKKSPGFDYEQTIWDTVKIADSFANVQHLGQMCEEQEFALKKIHTCPFVVLAGGAGAGKTETIRLAFNTQFDETNPLGVIVSAFQHKNVGHLARMVPNNRVFFTTHQLVNSHKKSCEKSKSRDPPPLNKDGKPSNKQSTNKATGIHYVKCTNEHAVIRIYDEGGILPIEIFARDLFAAVICSPNMKTVILSGDPNQLASLYAGSLLPAAKEICRKYWNSLAEYNHNHRVRSPQLFYLGLYVKTKQWEKFLACFDNKVAFRHDHPRTDEALQELCVQIVKAEAYEPQTSHFITYTNLTKDVINRALEQHYQGGRGIVNTGPYDPKLIYPGSKIIILNSDRRDDVLNGEILIVVRIYDKFDGSNQEIAVANSHVFLGWGAKRTIVCIDQSGQTKTVNYTQEIRNQAEKAFCTTNHKFLGDQTPGGGGTIGKYDDNASLYTLVTRFQNEVHLIADVQVLYDAFHRDPPVRNCGLVDMVDDEMTRRKNLRERAKHEQEMAMILIGGGNQLSEQPEPIVDASLSILSAPHVQEFTRTTATTPKRRPIVNLIESTNNNIPHFRVTSPAAAGSPLLRTFDNISTTLKRSLGAEIEDSNSSSSKRSRLSQESDAMLIEKSNSITRFDDVFSENTTSSLERLLPSMNVIDLKRSQSNSAIENSSPTTTLTHIHTPSPPPLPSKNKKTLSKKQKTHDPIVEHIDLSSDEELYAPRYRQQPLSSQLNSAVVVVPTTKTAVSLTAANTTLSSRRPGNKVDTETEDLLQELFASDNEEEKGEAPSSFEHGMFTRGGTLHKPLEEIRTTTAIAPIINTNKRQDIVDQVEFIEEEEGDTMDMDLGNFEAIPEPEDEGEEEIQFPSTTITTAAADDWLDVSIHKSQEIKQ